MIFFYDLALKIYWLILKIASNFHPKAKKWMDGRKNYFEHLKSSIHSKKQGKRIWMHVSSLGEFEQGRPVVENLLQKFPQLELIVTFFSPSGYELRKNYDKADYVFYLPLDTKKNARSFLEIVNPDLVLFVKYDFWFHFLNESQQKNIPTFLISALFHKQQSFFKWYGGIFRKILKNFTYVFVQDQNSYQLAKNIGVENLILCGDTRIDRVIEIANETFSNEKVELFKSNKNIIIFGSSWDKEEEFLIQFLAEFKRPDWKFIIAPHDVSIERINKLKKSLNENCILFTNKNAFNNERILILDTVGFLAKIYRYGKIAVIGGGFFEGIHSVLEPAAYNLPILFGPKHQKFNEAFELLNSKGAFCFNNYDEFKTHLLKLISNAEHYEISSQASENFIANGKGASRKIIDVLDNYL